MTNTRRDFLRNSAAIIAGATLIPDALYTSKIRPAHIGVQLYSVRDDIRSNPKATIEAIGKMGYNEVEGFGYENGKIFGLTLKEFSALLRENGLKMPSFHRNILLNEFDPGKKTISDDLKKTIDEIAESGVKYMIHPYIPAENRSKMEQYIPAFQTTAAYVKQAGMRFAYHNHEFEFIDKGPDGRLLIEYLLHDIDPALMTMQMDIYWVVFAKHNPLDWIRLYPGRWELCHAKDLAATEKRESIEFGDGVIDFRQIFGQSAKMGLKHYVLELEHYLTTPLKGIERSRQNLLKLKL